MFLSSTRAPRHVVVALLVGLLTATSWGLAPSARAAVSPPADLTPSGQSGEQPTLSWAAVAGATGYTIELSRSASFTTETRLSTASTVNTRWVPTTVLPETVWWRVNARTSAGTSDWAVASYTRPETQAPSGLRTQDDDGIFEQPREALRFSWDPTAAASSYTVEISQDDQFVDPARVTSYPTTSTTVTPQVLPAQGTYFWRVRGTLGTGSYTRWSEPMEYDVRTPSLSSSTNPVPAQPEYPADNETVTIEDVALDWKPIPGAASYRVQISTDRNFLTLSRPETTVVSTRYSPPVTLNNDQYFWRVRAVNSQGKESPWPEVPWSFRRAWDKQPSPLYPTAGSSVTNPLFFQWTPARLAARYTLQVSTTTGFANSTSCGTTVHTTMQPTCVLAAGQTYFWRVLAEDGAVDSEAIYSKVSRFTYDPDLVVLQAPAPGQVVQVPTLRWQGQAHALTYLVTVTSSSGRATVTTTSATSYTPKSVLAPDTYRWQVQPKSQNGQVGASLLPEAQRTFTVEDQAPGTASTPEPLPTTSAVTRFPTLRWTPVENATSYTLQVRRLGSAGWTEVLKTAYPAASDTGTGFLDPDTYEWRVTAYASGALLRSSLATATFVMAPFQRVTGQKAALSGTDLLAGTRTCERSCPRSARTSAPHRYSPGILNPTPRTTRCCCPSTAT